jgi:spore maturation protein SpmA
MVLNYIWIGFILVSFVFALVRLIGYYFREFFEESLGIVFGPDDLHVFGAIIDSTFEMAKTSVDIAIYLIGIMALWLGIMRIGEKGGAIHALGKAVNPFFRKLFPEVPANHPAMGSMLMNFSANILGLDNAATPLGLKAMKELQSINKTKDTASNAQIMFLVLNTSSLTLLPVSILAIREASGASNPADVFLPIMLATFFSTLTGLVVTALYQRINLFNRTILVYLGGATLFIFGLLFYLKGLSQEQVAVFSKVFGSFLLFFIIVSFVLLGIRKKVNIYETFIDGAKEGFNVAVTIIPYLVAMLVAIGIFRASGALEILTNGIRATLDFFGINTDFVGALPTAFMKPLSGSGARGMMVEAMDFYGPDSFVGRLASTFQGSTETTFYTLAVYYGVVNIKKTRYTVTCGLIADLAGIIAAIFIAYMFFK